SHGWAWRVLRPGATSISLYRRHRSTGQRVIIHRISDINNIYSSVMKRVSVHVLLCIFTVGLFSSCYDRGIVDAKDFDHSLPNVEALNYTKTGNTVTITWDLPANVSPAFRSPLEVSIQKVENDIYRDVIIVGGEGKSFNIDIDPNKSYRFVVKLAGNLSDDARETGKPDRVYSSGLVHEVQ